MIKKILKFLKLDLSKKEDKLKLFILIGGFLVVFGGAAVGGIAFTMRSEFCSSCHEMYPEYYTWQNSVHSQIGCVDCHIEPGVINLMKDKIGAMGQVYQHVTHSYDSPIEYPVAKKGVIKNEQCLKCHSMNRQYTLSGDITFSHAEHLDKDINCVECHSGVAHGKVAERGVSKDSVIRFNNWTSAVGAQQMATEYTNPTMETCVQCHMEKKQTTSCTSCHSEIKVPANHTNKANWQESHGTAALADINSCNKCHSYGFTATAGNANMDADQYAKTNKFCLDCHAKRPADHGNPVDETWISGHKAAAIEKGKETCLACHDLKPGDHPVVSDNAEAWKLPPGVSSLQMANKIECSQCHGKKFGQ